MSVAAFCSEDNKNSAHRPDQFNPEWYVQTPADSIVITTTNVSPAKQAYTSLSLCLILTNTLL